MKLTDIPPAAARDFFWAVIDRHKAAKERHPFKSLKTELYLTTDDARVLWAAWKWIEKYADWQHEATAAGGKVGAVDVEHDLTHCARRLGEMVSGMITADDVKIVGISEQGMQVVESAAAHLDHYALMMSFERSKKWKGKK